MFSIEYVTQNINRSFVCRESKTKHTHARTRSINGTFQLRDVRIVFILFAFDHFNLIGYLLVDCYFHRTSVER